MPPIRQLFVGVLIAMLAAFGLIFMIGGFETANGIPLNATIATNYNAIAASPQLPQSGVFCNATQGACIGGLASQVNNTSTNLQSYANNPLGSLVNTVSVVGGYIFEIGSFFGLLGGFIAAPLAIFMPVSFAQLIANIVLVGIFMFGLISAIFLVPV